MRCIRILGFFFNWHNELIKSVKKIGQTANILNSLAFYIWTVNRLIKKKGCSFRRASFMAQYKYFY